MADEVADVLQREIVAKLFAELTADESGTFARVLPPVKTCACGRSFDLEAWAALKYVGVHAFEDERLELRNCPCGLTLALDLRPDGVK